MGRIILHHNDGGAPARRPARTSDGTFLVTPERYREVMKARREQVTKAILPKNTMEEDAGDSVAVEPKSSPVIPSRNIEDMKIPPVMDTPNSAVASLALFDTTKDLLAKTRLPRRLRSLYTRAIVSAEGYNLEAMLNYVNTDLTLMIPEDGKARKEFLTPLENMLRGERARQELRKGPGILD